ncbi:MAG: GTP cyclohydrolase I FolE [Ignavibacteria bacterium]|nr:GTP cyclohydrolase I FolE [Ignavibacteria bacterium]
MRTSRRPYSPPRSIERLKSHYEHLLLGAGEDLNREGLVKTPERAAKAWQFLTSGYDQDPAQIIRSAVFEEEYDGMILVHNIEFYSLCEHHLLSFFGKAHIAYLPSGRIVGLSKLPRVVDALSRRLQVQERITKQIADVLEETLSPIGIAVQIEAAHLCMMIRGVEKQHSLTTTSAFRGVFTTDRVLLDSFFNGIRNGSTQRIDPQFQAL